MPIQTAAELFGDGGANGPQVPIDTSNPSGFNAANRGVAAGENITAAVKNRTPYALALNDEILDAEITAIGGRVLTVETTWSLDQVYRLGLTATAGGGRVITTDGGPVELQHTVTAAYAEDKANAAMRVVTTADAIAGTVGYDFVDTTDPRETTGNAVGGFVDRRALEFTTGSASVFSVNANARLNPGAFSFSTIELTDVGDRVSVSGPGTGTDLYLGYDLVEVSGSTANDGIYVVHSLGGGNGQVSVRSLHGNTSPNFATANEAVTVTFYRPRFASFGSNKSGALRNTAVAGHLSGDAALSLAAGIDKVTGGASVTSKALSVNSPTLSGAMVERSYIDEYGRMVFATTRGDLADRVKATRDVAHEGNFATKVNKTGNSAGDAEFGHIVFSDDANTTGRFDFTSLEPVTEGGFDVDVAITFTASSPTSGRLTIASASTADEAFVEQVAFAHITEPEVAAGWYRVTTLGAADTIDVVGLDGSTPAHFPTSGAGVCTVYRANVVGHLGEYTTNASVLTGGGLSYDVSSLFLDKPGTTLPTAVAASVVNTGAGEAALFRGFTNILGNRLEVFRIDEDGAIFASAGANFNDEVTASNFLYASPRSRDIAVGGFVAQMAANPDWDVPGTGTQFAEATGIAKGYVFVSLNHVLPEGASVTGITIRANNWGIADVQYGYYSRGGEAAAAFLTPLRSVTSGVGSTGFVDVSLSDAGTNGSTFTPILVLKEGASPREYGLLIFSYAAGAEIHSILVSYDDPGPRNV